MKIKDDKGIVVPHIQRTRGGGISVERSTEYDRYLKSLEMANKMNSMESELNELKALVAGLMDTINKK